MNTKKKRIAWLLAVSFPVGLGSGVLPRPLVIEYKNTCSDSCPQQEIRNSRPAEFSFFAFPEIKDVVVFPAYGR